MVSITSSTSKFASFHGSKSPAACGPDSMAVRAPKEHCNKTLNMVNEKLIDFLEEHEIEQDDVQEPISLDTCFSALSRSIPCSMPHTMPGSPSNNKRGDDTSPNSSKRSDDKRSDDSVSTINRGDDHSCSIPDECQTMKGDHAYSGAVNYVEHSKEICAIEQTLRDIEQIDCMKGPEKTDGKGKKPMETANKTETCKPKSGELTLVVEGDLSKEDSSEVPQEDSPNQKMKVLSAKPMMKSINTFGESRSNGNCNVSRGLTTNTNCNVSRGYSPLKLNTTSRVDLLQSPSNPSGKLLLLGEKPESFPAKYQAMPKLEPGVIEGIVAPNLKDVKDVILNLHAQNREGHNKGNVGNTGNSGHGETTSEKTTENLPNDTTNEKTNKVAISWSPQANQERIDASLQNVRIARLGGMIKNLDFVGHNVLKIIRENPIVKATTPSNASIIMPPSPTVELRSNPLTNMMAPAMVSPTRPTPTGHPTSVLKSQSSTTGKSLLPPPKTSLSSSPQSFLKDYSLLTTPTKGMSMRDGSVLNSMTPLNSSSMASLRHSNSIFDSTSSLLVKLDESGLQSGNSEMHNGWTSSTDAVIQSDNCSRNTYENPNESLNAHVTYERLRSGDFENGENLRYLEEELNTV